MNAGNMPGNAPVQSRGGSIVDAIRGPIMLIALGLLMAADQMNRFGIDRTWPALLILYGLLKLAAYAGRGGQQA